MTASLNVNHYAINNSQQEKYFGKKLKVVSSLNHIFPLLSNDKSQMTKKSNDFL